MFFDDTIYEDVLVKFLGEMGKNLEAIYDDAIWQLSMAVGNTALSADKFKLVDYPQLDAKVKDVVEKINSSVLTIINAKVSSSWSLSDVKNSKLLDLFFDGKADQLSDKLKKKYYNKNLGALQSFLGRKTNGLKLSDRVWKYNNQYKNEIEDALHIGIGNGVSADKMANFMTKYLRNPSATIYEVDKAGIAKEMPNSNVGQGVYRNPKDNAMRLARTEINMAYRTADHERWKDFDFVVGYEVKLSHNHTTKKNGKAVRFVDMCDFLRGKYPKDFKFVGWHPNCRCYATPILKTDEEIAADNRAMLRGEEMLPTEMSKNFVKSMPSSFNKWKEDNKPRLEKSKSLPYIPKKTKNTHPFPFITHLQSLSKMHFQTKSTFGAILSQLGDGVVLGKGNCVMMDRY